MWLIGVNKTLLLMKMHYFLYSGCIATILSFGSTYAKQLGYSKITVGYIMMSLFVISMLTKPAVGAIVDKFRVKKYMFLVFIFTTGVSAFFLMFVSRLSLETSVELDCNVNITTVKIYFDHTNKLSDCDQKILMGNNGERLVNCKLYCNNNEILFSEMLSTSKNGLNINSSDVEILETKTTDFPILIHLHNSNTERYGSYNFRVRYVDINHSRMTSPVCHRPTITPCQLYCPSPVIMELAATPKSQKTIVAMPEFWEFFSLLCIFWISQSGIWAIQDPICFDLLEDKPNDFGKQRCWTSIGWGSVTMLSGWLVDYFSYDKVQKDYTPISYLILSFMILNFFVASNIPVVESKLSQNTFQNVFKLFGKLHVISFFVWILLLGVYSSMTMSYLFWYLEDLATEYQCHQMAWIKTLQGFSQGAQSFFGEMPVFFCSGWIIKRIGHKHCMSLVLFAFTVRFFFYSIMTNPFWVLLIEILNGMAYALGRAVMVSYSRRISPPSAHHTVLGLVGLFDCIGLSLGGVLASHIYDFYGGVWLFRLFSYGSAVMCVLQITYNLLTRSNEKTIDY
ncbi:major facilitator superfamily domain-containing protein 6-A isoform X1 [Acyrthosiphon pisum]|uniref:Major facilitator superfamily associated domain-containing protein n=1 Tax=Acyrthosiphon pisum TaxID=7029 RepID=A0A8R2NRQ1_ACYPI|nr:major facilitator superfamily domain-containing protein 6-A isoform X1 [Acyrthosiphon pisum]XP_029346517.1 major facilitator superfamily domain-containing protein 6-A isoform X1 [Acyrthosiphon pisum]XP_029346518.1 major facilitator superfamily domain-containing protein 6-A isoform X1 [Acyrthosiphon pisum]|eukprot:XP_008183665.1 PREDICTED: major facilitator superfamily domain-containing protein 6-A [Acyrthosiphon pisum]